MSKRQLRAVVLAQSILRYEPNDYLDWKDDVYSHNASPQRYRYLRKRNVPIRESDVDELVLSALKHNDYDMLNDIFYNGPPRRCRITSKHVDMAFRFADVKMWHAIATWDVAVQMCRGVQLSKGLQSWFATRDINAWSIAIQRENLEALEWLHAAHPKQADSSAIKKAIEIGNLSILEWILSNAWPIDLFPSEYSDMWKSAADNGHIHVLQWMYDLSFPWGGFVIGQHPENTTLWLLDHECPGCA